MDILLISGMVLAAFAVVLLTPVTAYAHCDTMDGPTASDGMKALESGNINYALKWIAPEFEAELTEVFELSRKVRVLNEDAKELADRFFIESLVRIHRAGEGAPFEGVKPHGTAIDPKIAAADQSLEAGNLSPLSGMIEPDIQAELEDKFRRAMNLRNYDVNDLAAAREYIEAYVQFFKLAEGEEHEEYGHVHGHDHGGHHSH